MVLFHPPHFIGSVPSAASLVMCSYPERAEELFTKIQQTPKRKQIGAIVLQLSVYHATSMFYQLSIIISRQQSNSKHSKNSRGKSNQNTTTHMLPITGKPQ